LFSSSKDGILKNKRAIITGSTSGIGLGIAKVLAENGCNITLNGFGKAEEIKQIKEDISKNFGVQVLYHPADMRKPNEIRQMIQETKQKFGGIDILVNNAGIQFVAPVHEFPEEKWNAIIDINLNAVFHATAAVLPLMQSQKWGRIINISSVHGLVASVNKSAYVAAKHAVVGFTKTVALENAGLGITCNSINPGWVLTPLVQLQIEARAKEKNMSIEAATHDLLFEKQPSLQFAKTTDIGDLVRFLCTSSADQITGISIPIDGGWVAR